MANIFITISIREFIDNNQEYELNKIINSFSCPLNLDVEHFLKHNCIEFTKKSQSVTYLVFNKNTLALVGYFCIAIKPLEISSNKFSNTVQRKINRIAKRDPESGKYLLAAYLIAQLGKNFTNNFNMQITGTELLNLAIDKALELKYIAGGTIVFLEAENNNSILNFYGNNKFIQFSTRLSSGFSEQHEMIQLLKLI